MIIEKECSCCHHITENWKEKKYKNWKIQKLVALPHKLKVKGKSQLLYCCQLCDGELVELANRPR